MPSRPGERANESLAEYQRMREWFVWAESDFPRTSTGKPRINVIARSVLRSRGARPRSRKFGSKSAGGTDRQDLRAGDSSLSPDANLEDD